MTGAQFARYYPGTFARLFTEDMIHHGFQWQAGLNVCPDFCPITECGNGLYFLYFHDLPYWVNYKTTCQDKQTKMRRWAYVTIPPDTTVVIQRIVCRITKQAGIKFKAKEIYAHETHLINRKDKSNMFNPVMVSAAS